jgi:hypothetical protein
MADIKLLLELGIDPKSLSDIQAKLKELESAKIGGVGGSGGGGKSSTSSNEDESESLKELNRVLAENRAERDALRKDIANQIRLVEQLIRNDEDATKAQKDLSDMVKVAQLTYKEQSDTLIAMSGAYDSNAAAQAKIAAQLLNLTTVGNSAEKTLESLTDKINKNALASQFVEESIDEEKDALARLTSELVRQKTERDNLEAAIRRQIRAIDDLKKNNQNTTQAEAQLQDSVNETLNVFRAQQAQISVLTGEYGDNEEALRKLAGANLAISNAQGRVENGFAGVSRALAQQADLGRQANQTLLELGRGFGDAGMFAVDFRMGILSVGNNITQTAEAMGNLVRNAKAQAVAMQAAGQSATTFGLAIKSLASSMMGIGGLMVAINVAMAALQFWSMRSAQAKKDTDALNDSFIDLAKTLSDKYSDARALFSRSAIEDVFNVDGLNKQREQALKLLEVERQILNSHIEYGASKSSIEKQQERVNKLAERAGELQDRILSTERLRYSLFLQSGDVSQVERVERARASVMDGATNVASVLIGIGSEIDEIFKDANKEYDDLIKSGDEFVAQYYEIIGLRNQEAAIRIQVRAIDAAMSKEESPKKFEELANQRLQIERRTLTESAEFAKMTKMEQDEAIEKLNREHLDRMTAMEQQKWDRGVQMAGMAFSAVNDLAQFAENVGLISAKRAFQIQKAGAAGETTINTIATVQKIMSQGGIWATPLAVAAGVAGAARVAAILSTPFGGKGGRDQTGRTMADGGGSLREGFFVEGDKLTRGVLPPRNAPSAMTDAGLRTQMSSQANTVIQINSALNQEVLAYNVNRGNAVIRQNSTIMTSDV